MEHILNFEGFAALAALIAIEVVLGIDNIVFLAIVTGRLERSVQSRARRIGLILAMLMRIALLFAITWVMGLKAVLFTVGGLGISGKDLILLAGGLFLMAKATWEIHHKLEGPDHGPVGKAAPSFTAAVLQVIALDLVFSLDSVLTAVGMTPHVEIMVAAVIVAVAIMMIFAGAVSRFIERHPTFKMLALAFLLLIGVMLVAESTHQDFNKGYIYFAMTFSLVVEVLNMRVRRHSLGGPAAAHGG